MRKDELIAHISEGIRTEESASAIYLKHLNAIVGRGGLPNNVVVDAKRIIDQLISANDRHKGLLSDLRERVSREEIDVY